MLARLVQFLNADAPMLVIDAGTVILVIAVFSKVEAAISVMLLRIETAARLVQSLNADEPIMLLCLELLCRPQ